MQPAATAKNAATARDRPSAAVRHDLMFHLL
jgi:hypothetical protein